MNIITFERFWSEFHNVNYYHKINKTSCRTLWNNCNCIGKKKNAIEAAKTKTKLSAYEFLKEKLK